METWCSFFVEGGLFYYWHLSALSNKKREKSNKVKCTHYHSLKCAHEHPQWTETRDNLLFLKSCNHKMEDFLWSPLHIKKIMSKRTVECEHCRCISSRLPSGAAIIQVCGVWRQYRIPVCYLEIPKSVYYLVYTSFLCVHVIQTQTYLRNTLGSLVLVWGLGPFLSWPAPLSGECWSLCWHRTPNLHYNTYFHNVQHVC